MNSFIGDRRLDGAVLKW